MQNKILVHTCCAPCLCYTHKMLVQNNYAITGYWFNPNIHPFTEYQKRYKTLGEYRKKTNLAVIENDHYHVKEWLAFTEKGWKLGKRERCRLCYTLRLQETVKTAKQNNFPHFTSTLLYSKYQYHDDIKSIGEQLAKEHSINFVYMDFRQGWHEGIKISKELELYRQRYCGCIFSESEKELATNKHE